MKILKYITNYLETRACIPAYSGLVLCMIAICFFGAAINTMAGWLYVISGVSFALLGIGAFLPPRSLTNINVTRLPITPVTSGDDLVVEIEVENSSKTTVSLLQIKDIVPFVLGKSITQSIENIFPQQTYRWKYYYPTQRRGIFRWQTVELATGAPLGLFWCRRQRQANAKAIVYPTVIPLATCPLVDELGQEDSQRKDPRGKPFQMATAGVTRSLRPYRVGDPIRLIHWRSSARYNDLRVRELELTTGGKDIIIALDNSYSNSSINSFEWEEDSFEQAVITAASLYNYASKMLMPVQLWTASTGLIRGKKTVLETLAGVNSKADTTLQRPQSPIIWLTQNPLTLSSLPQGSRWVIWDKMSSEAEKNTVLKQDSSGLIINSQEQLQPQLQKALN
ncbi:MAG: DUF58 domain-containing protein [Cyanobacteria bacterium P01_A01_bin.45]